MTTFEIENSTKKQRAMLRLGYDIEQLDSRYTNVTCEDAEIDDLSELLDEMGLEYRLA